MVQKNGSKKKGSKKNVQTNGRKNGSNKMVHKKNGSDKMVLKKIEKTKTNFLFRFFCDYMNKK